MDNRRGFLGRLLAAAGGALGIAKTVPAAPAAVPTPPVYPYGMRFQVYQNDQPVSLNHPLQYLLNHPNQTDTGEDLLVQWTEQLATTGTALVWTVPNASAPGVAELHVLETNLAVPVPSINEQYPAGYYRIYPSPYPYGPFDSNPDVPLIDARQVLRHRYPRPVVWFDSAPALDPIELEQVRMEFERAHHGPENAGRVFIAQPGTTLEPWGQFESTALPTYWVAENADSWACPHGWALADVLTRQLAPRYGSDLTVRYWPLHMQETINVGLAAKALTLNEARALRNRE